MFVTLFISPPFEKGYRLSVAISKPVVFGRANCVVNLTDDTCSRRHARLSLSYDGYLHLTDLKSTNGTLVKNNKIKSASLKIGDRFTVGHTEILIVRLGERPEGSLEIIRGWPELQDCFSDSSKLDSAE